MRPMILVSTLLVLLGLSAGASEMPAAAPAPLAPQVQNGVKFLTGGVGEEEQSRLLTLDKSYNLRVALTDSKGEYLSGVDVTIQKVGGHDLVQTTTFGPILLAELAPGRYVIRTSDVGRRPEERVVDVPKLPKQTRLYVAMPEEGVS